MKGKKNKRGQAKMYRPPRRASRPTQDVRPTLVLKAHASFDSNISGVSTTRVTIVPSLAIFAGDVLEQAKFFAQYRISNITVNWMCVDPVNFSQPAGYVVQCPIVYQVPLINYQVPSATVQAFLAYKNVRFFAYNKSFTRSFVPFVNTSDTDNRIFKRSPRLPCTKTDALHYGLSYLFVKPSTPTSTYSLKAVITADVQFFTYDGNQGVAFDPSQNLTLYKRHQPQAQKVEPVRQVQQGQEDLTQHFVIQRKMIPRKGTNSVTSIKSLKQA